jgi:2-desacetyl-2-hydroxyethyl bacteriochlorophyllide A dehydrogenase
MEAKAIIFTGPCKTDFGTINHPEPGPGEVITRTVYTGVSTGTETRVLSGKQDGSKFPLIPGYENLGVVEKVGPGVSLKVGTPVFVRGNKTSAPYNSSWGCQVSHALWDADNCIPLPEGTDLTPFIYTKVGSIALHGVNRGRVKSGEKVAVVGLGLIGHLAAQIAHARGAIVVAIDTNQQRLDAIKAAGIPHVINATQEDPKAKIWSLFGDGVDVAFDVTGVASTVDTSAQLIHSLPWAPPYPASGRVVILGSYTEPVAFSYHESLFFNEPEILPSRDSTFDDMKAVVELIAKKTIDPMKVDAAIYPVEKQAEAYAKLMDRTLMRVIFKWS